MTDPTLYTLHALHAAGLERPLSIQSICGIRGSTGRPMIWSTKPPNNYKIGRSLWEENDADTGNPDHENVDAAWRRIFGSELDMESALGTVDFGDHSEHLLLTLGCVGSGGRGGQLVIVRRSYPGNAAIACALVTDHRLLVPSMNERLELSRGKRLSNVPAEDTWFLQFRRDLNAEVPVYCRPDSERVFERYGEDVRFPMMVCGPSGPLFYEAIATNAPPHPIGFLMLDTDLGRSCIRCGFAVPGGWKHAHAVWCEQQQWPSWPSLPAKSEAAEGADENLKAENAAEDVLSMVDDRPVSQEELRLSVILEGVVNRLRDTGIQRGINLLESKAKVAETTEIRDVIIQCVQWIQETR